MVEAELRVHPAPAGFTGCQGQGAVGVMEEAVLHTYGAGAGAGALHLKHCSCIGRGMHGHSHA